MRIIIITLFLGFAFSCTTGSKPEQEAEEIKTYDTTVFYYDIPLAVQMQIDEIKRNLVPIYSITTENGKRDSVGVDSTVLLQLAAPFTQYNLNESRFRKYYREDRYEDGDLRKIVFNYSTNHPDLPVRSASIWLDNETEQLSNIILKRAYASKDTAYSEDLTWTAGRGFMILQKRFAGGKEFVKQTNVYWKNR